MEMRLSVYILETSVRGGADGQILMLENKNLKKLIKYKGEKK